MKKNNKYLKLFYLSLLILVCFIFQTMAYSAINSTMTVTGTAYARTAKDVRVTGFKLSELVVDATSYYEEFGVDTISTKFRLENSSSSIVFGVEVTNYGTSDIGIFDLIGDVPSGLYYEIIGYSLGDKLCDDDGKCNQMAKKTIFILFTGLAGEYEITKKLDFRTYHNVTYTNIENKSYPTEVIDGGTLSINFKDDLKKVTVLSDGVEINYYDKISNGQTISINNIFGEIEIRQEPELLKVVSGNLDTIGSEICIGKECFYVISSTDDSVTMLAKYNLYVGNSTTSDWTFTSLLNPTGIQDSIAKAWLKDEEVWYGTVMFSNSFYWTNTVSSYPSYVYNENSTLYDYVENYKTYLESFGEISLEARVISYDELVNLGCSSSSCKSAPSWVYSTSYWSGSAYSANRMWFVRSNGSFADYSTTVYIFGVRPVIEIPKWAFNETFEFTIDGVTYEAKEGMTWGDWVNSSYDTRGFVNNYDLIYTDDLMYALVYEVDYGTFVSHSWPYIDDLIDPNLVYVTFYEAGEDGEW